MGCPCHMVHNAAHYATKAFERNINFNSEKLLVNLYFHFDYSLDRKNLLLVLSRLLQNLEISYCKMAVPYYMHRENIESISIT